VSFEKCQLDLSSFYKLDLKNTRFTDCQLRETDFIECDLTGSVFDNCDLTGAVFSSTKLGKVDFRTSFGYSINPELNQIKKAKFSLPGIKGLLDAHDIEID
jgi:uncharacterized protein YjbI with pentapeptide repeats